MSKSAEFDVVIIGGGLAGLTSAIHLSQNNCSVLVIEKNSYPRHKVCGEYISNEVLTYLKSLGISPLKEGAKEISEFEITTRKNNKIQTQLPLGGFGISRYFFDNLLAKKATEATAKILTTTVVDVIFQKDSFKTITKNKKVFTSKFVIGSFGKRSNLDKKFNRSFIQRPSNYLGVKTHLKGKFPENKVALHNFKGGYCGVSKVENDHINLCYITNYKSFKKYRSIADFQEKVLFRNAELKKVFSSTKPVFKEPLTISQISFEKKPLIENHVLMCGDSAAMIHPLCGNGMGMAISSAEILSTLLLDFFQGKIKTRNQLEKMYLTQWNNKFRKRLFFGHSIARVFRSDIATKLLWGIVRVFPFVVPLIIKQTHGKP